MMRLVPYELGRIWRKGSFLLSVCVLFLIHLFLLWYTTLPKGEAAPLAAYRLLQGELAGKSEEEKEAYIRKQKEQADGVSFVQEVLAMQGFQNEMGDALAKQELETHPGMFEKYYGLYQSGDYLKYTETLEQEQEFLEEIFAEQQKVAGYGEYLGRIRENRDSLGGISVFAGQDHGAYSWRNLQKSAADYEGLTDQNIRFLPAKGITLAMEGDWTDLLLILGVMLFVGSLITEEKEKGMFFITRSTRYGVLCNIGAKLAALFATCVFLTTLLYMASLIYFGRATGGFDLGAGLQSVASYIESCLPVSILGYICLSLLTKSFVLFGIGAALTVFCIISGVGALPFLAGTGIIGGSALAYYLIPAGSFFAAVKYINPVGLMKTEDLYGGYLNFNLLGYPVSRLSLSLGLAFLVCAAGTAASLWSFCRMRSFQVRKLHLPFRLPFCPHTSILRHEGYKILIMNHGLAVLLLAGALLAYNSTHQSYTPSVMEEYYQNIMGELEGGLTVEKEKLVLSEKARYEEAFEKIRQVDQMVSRGEMHQDAADAFKAEANMTLAFYPAFERVQAQYEQIKSHGGSFVYDTGYLYLFGVLEDVFPIDFLMVSVGILLAVSGAAAMEYQRGSLHLISATKAGRRRVFFYKGMICGAMAAFLALIPFLCRAVCIASVYPMHSPGAGIRNIAYFSTFPLSLPLALFVLLFLLSQVAAAVSIALLTMAISVWRKNQAQTVFFALLFLAVPLILKLLGFEAAKWFSLYPLYGWAK